jgi:7-cyano-7-deazaguanine synthase in queuosine biosynthesis
MDRPETMNVVMFSGGLDSTYLIWKLLNMGEKVHAHHVSNRNAYEPMWTYQLKATRLIATELQKEHELGYTESVHEYFCSQLTGFDTDVALLHAQRVVRMFAQYNVELHLGWVPEDTEKQVIQWRIKNNITPNIWKALRASIGNPPNVAEDITFYLVENNIRKTDILQELPQELIDLTWSCRKPVNDEPCGKCGSCKDRNVKE